MRKRMYIIGARGFGRELALWLPMWPGFCDRYSIAGFLDDKVDALEGFPGYPPIVASVESYRPKPDDVFVCGLGKIEWRRKYIDIMLAKGAVFETLVCPYACVFPTARLGIGCLINGTASVSADVRIGDFVLVHSHATLSHDVTVGDHSVIENGVFAGGSARIGGRVTVHTRAIILPSQSVGDDAVVGAGSVVIRNVKAGMTVFGNPAERIDG